MPILFDLAQATLETLYMVLVSTCLAVLLGWPLGTLLFNAQYIKPNKYWVWVIQSLINLSRSIPFIILLVALIPLTRFVVGTSIGINAAIIPLTLGAAPFFARLVHNAYEALPLGLIDTGFALGATSLQMIRFIILPEAAPMLIQAITVVAITLVNYSAMAGTIGAGGLGDLAIRYGYQRFDVHIMLLTILILIILVQLIQALGDKLMLYYQQR